MDGEVPPPDLLPGGLMWIRGQFTDQEETRVVVGTSDRQGYVAEVPLSKAWSTGQQPPVGAPQASLIAGENYAVVRRETSATAGRAERWEGPAVRRG